MLSSPSAPSTQLRSAAMKQLRNNQQWLDDLRGQHGGDAQRQAYLDLADYLYKVTYNYLLKRQHDFALLAVQTSAELAELAQDCVQDTLVKLWANDAVLLNQYQGKGRFLGWAALIIRNHTAGILRRPPYTREVPLPADLANHPTAEPTHATRLTLEEVEAALQACLDALPAARRAALIGCILNGERSKIVAARLKRSINAVDQLVMHAKRQVEECLRKKEIGPEVLGLFT